MEFTKVEKFDIVGIKTRTQNNGNAAKDIPALWGRFMNEGIMDKIKHKIDNTIYCLYTAYDGDHTLPYDVVLGCKVSSIEDIPEGYTHLPVNGGDYNKYLAKGNIEQGEAVVDTWMSIWQANHDRAYTVDYEVYDHRSMDQKNAGVDIFIALKS